MGVTSRSSSFSPSGGSNQAVYMFVNAPDINKPVTIYLATGGALTPFFSTAITGEVPFPKVEPYGPKLHNVINTLTSCFNLTKDELATICKIQSRKTLYNWADGYSKPRALTMKRLFDLLMIANAWGQAGFPNDHESLHRSILQGGSVFDMLRNDNLDKDRILFAGSRLALTRSDRTSLKDPFA